MTKSGSPQAGVVRGATRGRMDTRRMLALAMLLPMAALAMAAFSTTRAPAAAVAQTPSQVVRIYGVGGVLTADGTLWQYRPETKKWLTIDEAFQEQGKTTRVLPLPVKAKEIREMATWGFLLTESGECWLYDLERSRWERLTPPQH